jgi:VWFA-related protein
MKRHRLPLLLLALALGSARTASAQADERVVYASVVDKTGAAVLALTEKDFVVREDGQAREILRVARDTDPLQIALLIDNSRSMRNQISDLRRAAVAFIDGVREGVPVALITLGERPTIAVAYTTDHEALKKGANRLFATNDSGNYLLDGIAESAQGLAKRTTWRSVIVAITGTADLSYRLYPDTLKLFRASGAQLHVLTLGTDPGSDDREIVVSQATDETGGRNETVLASMGLPAKAAQLASEISSQYRITYGRPQRLIPPKEMEVSVKDPDLRARGMFMKTEKERP